MKHVITALAVLTGLATATAVAQPLTRAENNDVFYTDKEGKKRVVLPPSPLGQARPKYPTPISSGQLPPVFMFQTEDGVVECSDLWRTTCQPSSYGVQQRGRWWIVRRSGLWHSCNGPESSAQCNLIGAYNGPKGSEDIFDPRVKHAPTRIH